MESKKVRIGIAGKGNVATHLLRAFAKVHSGEMGNDYGIDVSQLDSRHLDELTDMPDIILLCISDNAITAVSRSIPEQFEGILAHVSGTTPLSAIPAGKYRRGVFYPLQTFSKEVDLAYDKIPFFIEGEDTATEELLTDVARKISTEVSRAESNVREQLHLAGVFACNFTNHLYTIADRLLRQSGLDITVMQPLLEETLRKAMLGHPEKSQTGPAARHDTATIERHLQQLSGTPSLQAIYRIMTGAIITERENETEQESTYQNISKKK